MTTDLKQAATEYVSSFDSSSISSDDAIDFMRDAYLAGAAYAASRCVSVEGWRKISDTPESHGEYLVRIKDDKYFVAEYQNCGWDLSSQPIEKGCNYTHWAAINPPEGEK